MPPNLLLFSGEHLRPSTISDSLPENFLSVFSIRLQFVMLFTDMILRCEIDERNEMMADATFVKY